MHADDFQRVAKLFEQAREKSAATRAAWLEAETSNEPDLRAEVLRLLVIHDKGAASIDRASTGVQSALAELATHDVPDHVGPYRIVRELGAGGMGVVYLAEQSEPLRRQVALKIIRLGMNSVEVIARFDRERQTLARLVHPGIAQVYDAGTTKSGRPYFALEYVDGEPLTTYADRKRLPIRDRLALFTEVCRVVEHAHQKAIIHRDLKPSNLLVTEIDGTPAIKVIDFGIAKAMDDDQPSLTRLTPFGSMVGTPTYMSPEQAIGSSADLDTRSDIYSLGAVLYELLVGALPFDSEALRKANPLEVQRMLQHDIPPTPSTRAMRLSQASKAEAEQRHAEPDAWVRRLKGDLDWITMKALDKDPARRYASSGAFAADIERHLNHEPVEARPPSTAYKLRKFAARNRGLLASAAALLAMLIAGLIVSTRLYVNAEREREVAQARLAKIERHADRQLASQLRNEAESLWPALPSKAPAMGAWLTRARALAARKPLHRDTLASLRLRGRETKRVPTAQEEQTLADLRREELAQVRDRAVFMCASHLDAGMPTAQRPVTYYARHTFKLASLPTEPLAFRVHAFDAARLWINGAEFMRIGLPKGEITHTTPAGGPPQMTSTLGTIAPELLRVGTNTIAADVHVREPSALRMQLMFELTSTDGDHIVPIDARWHVAPPKASPGADWMNSNTPFDWKLMEGPFGFVDTTTMLKPRLAHARLLARTIERIRTERDAILKHISARPRWRFDDPLEQKTHDELEGLVDELDALADHTSESCLTAIVEARLKMATAIRKISIDEQHDAWAKAISEIRASPHYGELELTPQIGLVPLGPDPVSGLQEFARVGLGNVPIRSENGALQLEDEMTMVLVLVPGGDFQMGARPPEKGESLTTPGVDPMADRGEYPIHEVTLSPFFLSKFEMTQAQWILLAGENPSMVPVGREAQDHTATPRNPVEAVSWADANRTLARIGLVLPTEAQWEYAVRAGTTTPWWFGSDPKLLQGKCNIADQSAVRSGEPWSRKAWGTLDDGYLYHAPAGTFDANPWGFHEMLGNVREWCLDRTGRYEAPVRRGDGLRTEYVAPNVAITRGSSFSGRMDTTRSTYRGRVKASVAETWVGIRPARRVDR